MAAWCYENACCMSIPNGCCEVSWGRRETRRDDAKTETEEDLILIHHFSHLLCAPLSSEYHFYKSLILNIVEPSIVRLLQAIAWRVQHTSPEPQCSLHPRVSFASSHFAD